MKLSRSEVYNLLDGERAYQDIRWANDQVAHPKVMEIIRKIGGMAVAAMEQNGCNPRI